jgi:glycosyltransferase involved in cell wall biosynthesis
MSSGSSSAPEVSVVVPSHNEGPYLRDTVHALLATLPPRSEVVVVDDASDDGSADFLTGGGYGCVRLLRPSRRLGAPAARNAGAVLCRSDVIVFSDAHVTPPMGWAEVFLHALARPGVGAVAPVISVAGRPRARGHGLTWRDAALRTSWLPPAGHDSHAVPILPGGFLAVRRAAFEECGGFDPGLVRWGSEDQELSVHLWSRGYDCLLLPRVDVAHRFRARHPYRVEPEETLHNKLRMAAVHFGRRRFAQVVAALRAAPAFAAALALLLDGDAAGRRAAVRLARQRDDDWFCARFGITALL